MTTDPTPTPTVVRTYEDGIRKSVAQLRDLARRYHERARRTREGPYYEASPELRRVARVNDAMGHTIDDAASEIERLAGFAPTWAQREYRIALTAMHEEPEKP